MRDQETKERTQEGATLKSIEGIEDEGVRRTCVKFSDGLPKCPVCVCEVAINTMHLLEKCYVIYIQRSTLESVVQPTITITAL